MKKRIGPRGKSSGVQQRNLRDFFRNKPSRCRRSWTFERLEDRCYFAADLLAAANAQLPPMQLYTISSETPEGQALIDALSYLWAEQSSSGSATVSPAVRSIPTDPQLLLQWHLLNVGQVVNPGQFQDIRGVPGQDINVVPVWDQGITGAGVLIAVVDSGVELNHPDLAGNIDPSGGFDALRLQPGGSNNGDEGHGTSVAGLIAAVANNGQGGTGVAYGATLYPIRLISQTGVIGDFSNAFIAAIGANGAPIDIYNHSWGPTDGLRAVAGPDMQQLIVLTNSARLGRNGLGAIHVWAAGNGAEALDSAGSDGYVNSRYTIGVGIVDHDGKVPNADGTSTDYGEMAPSVLIVAPSASGPTDIINNFATGSGLFTTDLTGAFGYNQPPLPSGIELDIDTFPDPDYTTRFGGTSGATPLVSGVIALMLEANPNLSYRDVQEILVRSARQNDDLDESWITNLVPLFRDPVRGGFGFGEGDVYPDDGVPWNDEIIYKLIPGMEIDPAMQATTGPVSAADSMITVTAKEDGDWAGWVGNNLTLVFRAVPGDEPGVVAEVVSVDREIRPTFPLLGTSDITDGLIRVTVTGEGVTWEEIAAAISSLGDDGWFDVTVSNPLGFFDPSDVDIVAPLTGGKDATGLESELVRNPVFQTYHPIADPLTNPEPKSLFTNGAGYTVSHGRGGNSEYGWAHGVINAELAVELAKQWHTKDQNLPPEKTYLIGGFGGVAIRPKGVTDQMSGEYVIPGALSNSSQDFIAYFNEFFKEPTIAQGEEGQDGEPPTPDSIDPQSLPFGQDNPPANTRGAFISMNIPAINPVDNSNNLMSIEWVEVQLNITGDANAFNYLRITLVSPDGTQSELTQNQYMPEDIEHNFQSMATDGVVTGFGDSSITALDENGGHTNSLVWVYSTNRHWGERSDSNPLFDDRGNFIGMKGWELHFENYSGSGLFLNSANIAFHGSPIGSPSGPVERVMGKIGIDSGRFVPQLNDVVGDRDGLFNFDRYVTTLSPSSNAFTSASGFFGGSTPYGEHEIRLADTLQEQFAGNITVYAIDTATNLRVAQFVTGYDGNYYFDLPAGTYKIGIEDPLGRSVLGGGLNYDSEWTITIDTTDILTRTAGETVIDPSSPFPKLVRLYNDLNFLLDPGADVPSEVIFTGQVSGDLNGNGIKDATDAGVYNFTVYADLNHTGQFEIGEPFVQTDANGFYELHIPTAQQNTFTIGVKPPVGWTVTGPPSGFHNEYTFPGETNPGFNFLVKPPSTPSGVGNGTIFGLLFNDKNGNGIQDTGEQGLPGRTVFIDTPVGGVYNGILDPGEIYTITDAGGAYQFGEVPPGTVRIDTPVDEPFIMTTPVAGFRQVTLSAGQVSTNNNFGIRNLAVSDFGDLVGDGYATYGPNAASHLVVPGFQLGPRLDAEVRSRILVETAPGSGVYVPNMTLDGIADDQEISDASFDDEDGVVVVSNNGLVLPGVNLFQITVQGVGGYLTGWIDWFNDGFDSGDKITWRNQAGTVLGNDIQLAAGTWILRVDAPVGITTGPLAARFRWGEQGLNYFGPAVHGEVEDYRFNLNNLPGDYSGNGTVDLADYVIWRKNNGTNNTLLNDFVGGTIGQNQYNQWKANFGRTVLAGGAAIAFAEGTTVEPPSAAAVVSSADAPLSTEPLAAAVATTVDVQLAEEITRSPSAEPLSASSAAKSVVILSQSSVLSELPTFEVILSDGVARSTVADSNPNLLLLDQAWAELEQEASADADAEDAPLFDRSFKEDEDVSELALVSLFDDESSWWAA